MWSDVVGGAWCCVIWWEGIGGKFYGGRGLVGSNMLMRMVSCRVMYVCTYVVHGTTCTSWFASH